MLSTSVLEKLKASVRGRCFCPGEQGYDEARKIHNAMIDRCPAIIVHSATGEHPYLASACFNLTSRWLEM